MAIRGLIDVHSKVLFNHEFDSQNVERDVVDDENPLQAALFLVFVLHRLHSNQILLYILVVWIQDFEPCGIIGVAAHIVHIKVLHNLFLHILIGFGLVR